jgi:hypothetical protein
MDFLAKTVSQVAKTASIDDPANGAPFIVRFELAKQKVGL